MSPVHIELDSADLKRLHKALDRLGRADMLQPVLKAIALDIKGKTKVYPPAPIYTGPTWYERGYGMRPYGKQTSERLGNRWYVTSFPTYSEVGNLASYAGWVHGEEQAHFHKARGWKQLLKVATDEMPNLVKKAKAQILKIWAGG